MYTDWEELRDGGVREGVEVEEEGLNMPKLVELLIELRSWNWFEGGWDFGLKMSPLSLIIYSKI